MKYNLLIGVLVSFLTISPSYAQVNIEEKCNEIKSAWKHETGWNEKLYNSQRADIDKSNDMGLFNLDQYKNVLNCLRDAATNKACDGYMNALKMKPFSNDSLMKQYKNVEMMKDCVKVGNDYSIQVELIHKLYTSTQNFISSEHQITPQFDSLSNSWANFDDQIEPILKEADSLKNNPLFSEIKKVPNFKEGLNLDKKFAVMRKSFYQQLNDQIVNYYKNIAATPENVNNLNTVLNEFAKQCKDKQLNKNLTNLLNELSNQNTEVSQNQTYDNPVPVTNEHANSGWTYVPVSKNEVQPETNHSNKIVSNSKHSSDESNVPKNELKTIKDENDNLKKENEELKKLLNKFFMQKWGEMPFSKFDENSFQKETQEIEKALQEKPNIIQYLIDDYQDYLEGMKCINSQYDEKAINSIVGKIKTIRDKAPNKSEKKKELTELHEKLSLYEDIVRLFQSLIKDVKKMPGISKKDTLERTFKDKDVVDPEAIEYIESIPWLKKQLPLFKQELLEKKTDSKGSVTNTILHLLDPKE